jgi:microcystin-dependent protein
MMPVFWLADGSYRARATSSDGSRTFFDLPVVLALGASAGSAPSGGVDPNAIYQTGDIKPLDQSGSLPGWVRDNGRTLGSATSGAAERANSDCLALFEFLWNTYSDTLCPVVTGRGISAAADWGANKQITLRDYRGKLFAGLDDMGNSAASRFTGVPFTVGSETVAGSLGGEAIHTLTLTQLPAPMPSIVITDPGHAHVETASTIGSGTSNAISFANVQTSSNSIFSTASATTGVTAAMANAGGSQAHNTMPPFFTGTWYRKL